MPDKPQPTVMFLPRIELMAALRMSFKTAEREGFPRTAAQVNRYIEDLVDLPHSAEVLIIPFIK